MKKILCFGDSNTYGYIPGGVGRYGEGVRWTSILNGLLSEYDYSVIEAGLCGRTTIFEDEVRKGRRGTAVLPELLKEKNPDAVFIMLGTNDCKKIYRASSELITTGMESLIRQVKRFDASLPIVIISPISIEPGISDEHCDPDFDERAVDVSRELPEKYSKLASNYNIGYFPASKVAIASDVDKEHMDSDGHRALAYGLVDYAKGYLAC